MDPPEPLGSTLPILKHMMKGLEELRGIDESLLEIFQKLCYFFIQGGPYRVVTTTLMIPLLAHLLSKECPNPIESHLLRKEGAKIMQQTSAIVATTQPLQPLMLEEIRSFADMIRSSAQTYTQSHIHLLAQPLPSPPVPSFIPFLQFASLSLPRIGLKLRSSQRSEWIKLLEEIHQQLRYLNCADSSIFRLRHGSQSSDLYVVRSFSDSHQSGLANVKDVLKQVESGLTWTSRKIQQKPGCKLMWTTESERYGRANKSRTLLSSVDTPALWLTVYHEKQKNHHQRAKRQRTLIPASTCETVAQTSSSITEQLEYLSPLSSVREEEWHTSLFDHYS